MIRVAIVGCGKIADSHAEQIRRLKDVRIVGACDREELMARQFGERFGVSQLFVGVKELIDRTQPNVIHITTPPSSHFDLAANCLEAGCHVYVEKPFTLYAEEAERLLGLAAQKNLKITVGHDSQFTHAARRMRELINTGYLGGKPVHMESYYCYGFGQDAYGRALLGDKRHWVRQLPGQLLHNVISHGISTIAEYLGEDEITVRACGFTSNYLKQRGETELVDEARVVFQSRNCSTAYFTFSSQMRPILHQFRIYGPENSLVLDFDQQTVIKMRGRAYKSYAEKVVHPLAYAKQYVDNAYFNVKTFIKNDFHMKSGMKALIESFYRSVSGHGPIPIAYEDIVRTSRIMEAIFVQLRDGDGNIPTRNMGVQGL